MISLSQPSRDGIFVSNLKHQFDNTSTAVGEQMPSDNLPHCYSNFQGEKCANLHPSHPKMKGPEL